MLFRSNSRDLILFTKGPRRFIPIVLAGVLFTDCSADPNKRKFGYLQDAEKYFKSGKSQEAVIQYRNALAIDPRFAPARYGLGEAYLALNRTDAAYRELTEAVTLDPANLDARLKLARLLLGRRQLDQAQSFAQRFSPRNRAMPGRTQSWVKSTRSPATIAKPLRNLKRWLRLNRSRSKTTERWVPRIAPPANFRRLKTPIRKRSRRIQSPPKPTWPWVNSISPQAKCPQRKSRCALRAALIPGRFPSAFFWPGFIWLWEEWPRPKTFTLH